MRRTYRNPPIDEALVEFQFASGGTWDLTVPGRLHEALKAEYPEKPRQQKVVTANIVVPQGEQPAALTTVQGLGKVQFPAVGGTRLVAVGPDVLSIHILRKYSNWEDFRGRTSKAFDEYCRVTDPAGVLRIGLRYINRVVLPNSAVDLSEYFRIAAHHVDGLPTTSTAFVHRDEFRYGDGVKLTITFATLAAPEEKSSFLLDIDLSQTAQPPAMVNDVFGCLDALRARERDVFESIITDKLRTIFDDE